MSAGLTRCGVNPGSQDRRVPTDARLRLIASVLSSGMASMKAHLITLLSFAAPLAAPLSAIQVTFFEDTGTRAWFSVVWGETPSAPLAFLQNGPFSDAGAIDMDTEIQGDHISPIQPGTGILIPFFNTFYIEFAPGERTFAGSTISDFEGTAIWALPGEPYGAQVLYGQPLPDGSVPERFVTAFGLLMVAARALLARRSSRVTTLTHLA